MKIVTVGIRIVIVGMKIVLILYFPARSRSSTIPH